jgi:hypothetical protein
MLERRVTMAGGSRTCLGRHGDRIREPDKYLDYMRRCDHHITDAEGDAPLAGVLAWDEERVSVGPVGQDKSATPTRLIALEGGSDIPVGRTPVIVGRHPRCDARLDSIRVSRLHCCLAEGEGGVMVRDLGSANGTRINGRRVELGRLRLGDELSIAHLRYRVEDNREEWRTLANWEDELPDRYGPPDVTKDGPMA